MESYKVCTFHGIALGNSHWHQAPWRPCHQVQPLKSVQEMRHLVGRHQTTYGDTHPGCRMQVTASIPVKILVQVPWSVSFIPPSASSYRRHTWRLSNHKFIMVSILHENGHPSAYGVHCHHHKFYIILFKALIARTIQTAVLQAA